MISVRKATLNDCEILAPDLRAADRAEAEAFGLPAHEALVFSLQMSEEAFVGEVHGRPFCIFGVGGYGRIWMVGTEAIVTHRVHFLRHSKEWLSQLLTSHPVLWNWIDSRNDIHLCYLRWLGCRFTGRQVEIGPNQIPFLEFIYSPCVSS